MHVRLQGNASILSPGVAEQASPRHESTIYCLVNTPRILPWGKPLICMANPLQAQTRKPYWVLLANGAKCMRRTASGPGNCGTRVWFADVRCNGCIAGEHHTGENGRAK